MFLFIKKKSNFFFGYNAKENLINITKYFPIRKIKINYILIRVKFPINKTTTILYVATIFITKCSRIMVYPIKSQPDRKQGGGGI